MKLLNIFKLINIFHRSYFKLATLVCCIVMSGAVLAQNPTVSDLRNIAQRQIKKLSVDSGKIWKTGGLFNINLGQGSQSNWAAGGDDFSLSVASHLGWYAFYKKDSWSWDNTFDFNYGLVNTTSLGTRKNDDRIDFLSKVGYALKPKLNVTTLLNFHSQFSKGYNYTSADSKELLSDFLSPGYILLSVGPDYKPVEGMSLFVSPITSRWIIVIDDSLSAKGSYGVTPGKKVKNEIGAFASLTYLKDLNKIISYNGRLDLFSNYEHNVQNVDVMMDNLFDAKLSKVLTASLELDLVYDDDVKLFGKNHDSQALQLKSLLAAGVSLKF